MARTSNRDALTLRDRALAVGSDNFIADSAIKRLAADSALKGRPDPRWLWQCAAILAMLSGAVAGAVMVRRSVAFPFSSVAL
jgi:hypothetical protein